MRWFLGTITALVIAIAMYFGLAASSLSTLAAAARAGNGAKVLEWTDVKALNRSLTNQIIAAYLERIGATRRVSPMEKMLINTYGATIADAMVAKMLIPDNLTQILKTGNLEGEPGLPSFSGLPGLANLQTGNWLAHLKRLNIIQPALLGIRISDNADPESYAAINLHFGGTDWKLAGIELPKPIVRALAASLPAKN
jgi:hypothetical protein